MITSRLASIGRSLRPLVGNRVAQDAATAWFRESLIAKAHRTSPKAAARGAPLILAGFMNDGFGIGRAGRYTAEELRALGYEMHVHDLGDHLRRPFARHRLQPEAPGGTLLMQCNPPEAVAALARIQPEDWQGRYRVGYWAYELSVPPRSWLRTAAIFDEIWVPSAFVAEGFAGSGVPVRVMPHPVPPAAQITPRQDAFVVGLAGDFASSLKRKNLAGGLAIYNLAFPTPRPGVSLKLKVRLRPGSEDGTAAEALAAGRPDVHVISERLSDQEVDALWSSFSIFLSPHRAEGYGLVLAECMARGMPVLATGWSGNMEFMAGLDELLIAHDLVPVSDPQGIYRRRGLQWAEPSIEDGAAKLLAFYEGRVDRPALVAQGRLQLEQARERWRNQAREALPLPDGR